MDLNSRAIKFPLRPRYRLATLFALVTLVSVPLAIRAQREHDYRVRLGAVAVLLEDDGDSVGIEKAGRGPETRDRIYARSRQTLQRDEVVVEARCDGSDRDISAVLLLPTLEKLILRDVPTSRLEEPDIEFGPGMPEEDKEVARAYAKLWKTPAPPPTGSIDAAVRKIAKLPLLEALNLSRTSVSDDGVRSLTPARGLRVLDLSGTNITDAAMEHLCPLSELEELNLDSTRITDRGVRCLAAFPSLRVLKLRGTKVTGTAFENLSCLHALQGLDLSQTALTDEGVQRVAALGSLRELDLSHTKVSAAALKHLSTLRELSELSLWSDDVGDSLEQLARLPKLKRLSIHGARVSDAGLEAVAGSRSLEDLDLAECRGISDAGILHLSRLSSLREVNLYLANQVTAEGVAKLKQRRPALAVTWTDEAHSRHTRDLQQILNESNLESIHKLLHTARSDK